MTVASQNVRQRNPLKADDKRLKKNKVVNEPRVKLYTPLPWQKALLATPDDIPVIVCTGGRGGGKSTGMILFILREVLRHGKNFEGVLLRRDLAGLKRLITELEEQMSVIPQLQGSVYKVGDKTFEFSNGARLECGYIKDERSFGTYQGGNLTFLAVDEAAQLQDPAPLLRMMSSMRTTALDVTPKVILTANPNNKGSYWVYEHVVSKLVSFQPKFVELFEKNVLLIHSTLFDNSCLADPDSYIQTLKASCNGDEAKIASEVFGSWSAISGTFFSHCLSQSRSLVDLPRKLSSVPFLRPGDVWLAADWGTRSPSSILLAFRAREQMQVGNRLIGAGSVVVVDEIYTCTRTADGQRLWNTGDRSLTVSRFAELTRELCDRNGIALDKLKKRQRVMDAAVGADIGSDHGSIGYQLKVAGCPFVAGPKLRRAEGWQMLCTLMEAASDAHSPGLYISGRCESLWALLPRLTYAENSPDDLDSSQPDHSADALRYCVTAMADPRYRVMSGTATDFRIY